MNNKYDYFEIVKLRRERNALQHRVDKNKFFTTDDAVDAKIRIKRINKQLGSSNQ